MRVLIVSDISSYMTGGVPAETKMLISGLAELGHEVAFASDAPLEGCESAKHYPISIPVQDALPIEMGHILHHFAPDFVHVICMSSTGVTRLSRLLVSRQWALTVHSIPPYERKLSALHWNEMLHYTVRGLRFLANSVAWRWVLGKQLAPQVIVHSEFVKKIAVAYGCQSHRVVLILLPFLKEMQGAAEKPESSISGKVSVVSVGGIAHTKGQHDLIKSLPNLVRLHSDLHCELIGEVRDESYLRYIRKLAENLKVSDNVTITLNASNAHKEKSLRAADVYVQSSHEEGFCLAYAEGASVVPRVVGTDTGAMQAMSLNDAGMRIVPTRRSDALGRAIAEMIKADLPSDHMKARRERLAVASSRETYLRLHVELYEQALKPLPTPRQ